MFPWDMEELANTESIQLEEELPEESTIKESICLNTIQDIMEKRESEYLDFTRTEKPVSLLMLISCGIWLANKQKKNTLINKQRNLF